MIEPRKKCFTLSFEIDETFTVDELWPDGDAPEDPTVDDVENLIAACGGVEGVLRDWDLINSSDRFFVQEVRIGTKP